MPSLNEFRERNSHTSFTLTFKRTFGGAPKLASADNCRARDLIDARRATGARNGNSDRILRLKTANGYGH